ncbi:hypothetical protein [Streptomyces sp. NPDC049040]|uniref:hypothetical protein n=1 Tax=Streptomyces sp. NPDC049040 TaxID=3365593 RepID=UPI003723E4C1
MTRETDRPSSDPQGRGGAAYPSGTPPYGSRPFPSLHPQERTRPQGAQDDGQGTQDTAPEDTAPAADEPRTETTLTTRIRINIPGSRPIPPVVVRTTVDEPPAAAENAAQAAPAVEAEAPAEPEPEKTSDWFAPRKAAPPAAPPFGQEQPSFGQDQSTGGMPLPGGAPASPFGRDEQTGAAPLPIRNPGAGAPPPFGAGQDTGTPYLPPPVGGAPGEGEAARGSHDTPAGGFATPFASEAPPFGAGSPFDTGGLPPAGSQAPPFGAGSPFDTAAMPPITDGAPPYGTTGAPAADEVRSAYDSGAMPVVGEDRPGYDSGAMPVVGEGRPPYRSGGAPAGDDARSPYDTGSQPFGTDDFPPGVPRPNERSFREAEDPLGTPSGPTSGPATGSVDIPPMSQEAAQPPTGPNGFRPPTPGPRGGNSQVSGDTLVSGIPAVPSGESRPARQPAPRSAAPAPAPARTAPAAAAPAAAKPAKKGRSKPVMLAVLVCVVLVVGYGAGLLMNHADVPKGTTVLGVDIGNQNRDAAVKMLDSALGDRATAPIPLTIGGKKQSLKPSVAGLSIDTDATVAAVAHSDYNPISVIGSLFGSSRTTDPVFVVDEDKLKVALQALAGGSRGTDAMVRFEDGKAIPVPGKPRQTLDVVAATAQVEAAYRTRAETGTDTPVALNATTAPPKVSQAELDSAVNGFGKTAMSGKATVYAGVHKISFNTSLPKFLTMQATADGKLAPHIDLVALKGLYGGTFDSVLLKRADGTKTAVTPADVAKVLIQALSATNKADRTVTFPNLA